MANRLSTKTRCRNINDMDPIRQASSVCEQRLHKTLEPVEYRWPARWRRAIEHISAAPLGQLFAHVFLVKKTSVDLHRTRFDAKRSKTLRHIEFFCRNVFSVHAQ